MRFIYLGSFRFPLYDAAAARVLNIARALRKGGNSVSFISWGGNNRPEDIFEDGKYRFDGFSYIVTNEIDFKGGVFGKIKGWFYQGEKTKYLLKEQLGHYDAVITYNCCLIKWLIPFCKKNDIKLVTDITEWYEYNELKPFMWIGYALDMFYYQKRVRNKIVISQYLNKYYSSSHNIVIPATCDASEAKWHKGREKAEKNAGSFDGITLIYAGNPARKDAVHYAIGAVQRLVSEGSNLRFLIIGTTREKYIERYHSLLTGGELSERIQFIGRVLQDEVPSYYAIADFMVLLREPTRKSNAGFPTKFAESFTSGIPVIANLTSDLGSYLRDGITGFVVDEPSEESIYKTLKERALPLKRERIDKMKQDVKGASTLFDYHSYVESLRDFLDKLE